MTNMAVKVNLLPKEFKIGAGAGKMLHLTRMLGVIFLAVFVVFSVALGGYLIISSLQLNNLNTGNNSLKTQLKALETSESQLVVLKDRLSKIKAAQSSPSGLKSFEDFEPFIGSLSPSTSFNTLEISSSKIEASIVFKSNADLTNFVEQLSKSDSFNSVSLTSFSFNPAVGYLVSTEFKFK